MEDKQGFALIIVLLLLTLLSILAMDDLESNFIETQLIAHDWQQRKIKAVADSLLQSLEVKTQHQAVSCQIPITDHYTMMHRTTAWWQEASCAGNYQAFEYYYVIENFPCHGLFTGCYRITLLVQNSQNLLEKVMLQRILLKKNGPKRQRLREYQ